MALTQGRLQVLGLNSPGQVEDGMAELLHFLQDPAVLLILSLQRFSRFLTQLSLKIIKSLSVQKCEYTQKKSLHTLTQSPQTCIHTLS